MRRSVTVCGLKCGLNNSAIELNSVSTKPAAAMRGALTLLVFSALLVAAVLPAHTQTEAKQEPAPQPIQRKAPASVQGASKPAATLTAASPR